MSKTVLFLGVVLSLGLSISCSFTASAVTQTSSGSVQVSGVVPVPPPVTSAFINQPQNNSHFTTAVLVVMGTCEPDLLVRVFIDTELAGSITCAPDGTFIINLTLNSGQNILTVLHYDILNQPGPASPSVTVFFDEDFTVAPEGDSTIIINTGDSGAIVEESSDSQRLFEGTVAEPLSKVLGINTVVSPETNKILNIIINSLFILAVLVLAFMVLL